MAGQCRNRSEAQAPLAFAALAARASGCHAGRRTTFAHHRVMLLAMATVAFIATTTSPGCSAISAADRARLARVADAVIVSDPKTTPGPGYAVFPLGAGLGSWNSAGDILHGRSDHGVVSYQHYAFLLGGLSVNRTTLLPSILTSVVQYDMDTGLMEEMSPLPEPRYRFAYTELYGKIYVAGGTGDTDWGAPSDTVFMYDIATDVWVTVGKLTAPRSDACAAAVNGKVYVFGGYDDAGLSLASVEVCEALPANTTTTVPSTGMHTDPASAAAPACKRLPASHNMREARGDCRSVQLGGLVYVVGGSQWFNNTQQDCAANWAYCYRFISSVEVFNASSGVWSRRAPMISARGDFGIAALPGSRILVAGGERGTRGRNGIAMYDVEEYVVEHDVWVPKAALPQARFRHGLAVSSSGRVLSLGGNPTCDLTPETACYRAALATVSVYTDVPHPHLYAVYKPPRNVQ
ncbi:hypothetical protein PLESTB_000646000 [Pleodorina starrii]|uniref:Uncharacterized protein n=1 Tax=Pleodorina starrii TaxID=330485 RepID=A0A9W6BIA0_9CHLO|nr:hypothetical protein PLESTM_001307200 [Pleodorina starrii]GLC52584.1 hypothetical protein PLESTB_000646000 [Pleodorina starrii]GLC71589.1 hypothetical protein PLESTF_001138500 [Pleodorina starrii]